MAMPLPEMAKIETMLIRHLKKFHERFVERLQQGSKETLRSAAWQLDALISENKQYKDAEYLRTMLHTIEWVIQKKFGTPWTVEKAKRDLRGRTRGVNQFTRDMPTTPKKLPVSKGLQQALDNRLIKDVGKSQR